MKTLLKLIFDDPRLVSVLVIFLLLAGIFKIAHQPVLVAVSIWIGLVVSLLFALMHPLRNAMRSK